MSHRTIRTLLLVGAAFVAVLAFAPGAMAHNWRGDRNHDRIPDRWERANHLSLKVNQAKRDQDRDGLRNRAEFLANDNPRKADSDDDGTPDGQEQAGTVTSFTGGVLIVHLFNGDDVKGTVDANTEFECKAAQPTPITPITPITRAADDGNGGGDGGDDEGDGNHGGSGDQPGAGQSGHQGGCDNGDDDNEGDDDENENEDNQAGCDASKLTPGAIVGEAELKATAAGLVFTEIELVL